MRRAFSLVVTREADGYTVTVPALPGIVTGGRTHAEALAMAEDAIRCHVESLIKDGEPVPGEPEVGVEKLELELAAS